MEEIVLSAEAKADVRAIDQGTALRLLKGIAQFAATGHGDVKPLKGINPPELRLRLGGYRGRYYDHGTSLEVLRVAHRRDIYRF